MSTRESKLIVSLIDRISAPARGVTATINKLTAASRSNAARMAEVRGRMMDAVGAGYALYRGLSAPVNAAMQFESAMADVRKVVDFPTPDAFKKMGDDIRKMSLQMPMTADGIAAIVAAAGQSGIATNELLPFAEMAAKVGVAWEVSADQAGEALAKLKTALGLSVADTGLLADAINHLGNNTAASAPAILDMVRRVAPMASQFGLTAEQAAAFGSAMVGAGFEAEVASTSFLNMGRNLTLGASATARQQKAMKSLGLSSKTVAADMQKDAVGTIQDVFARLRAAPDHMRAALMSDIFGNESRALGPLITNADLLAKALGLVGDKSKYAGSAAEEYGVRAQTFDNLMILFNNRISDLNIAIGNALLPGLNSILGTVGPIITSISDLAQRFPGLTSAIVGVTAAVIGFKVAAIGAQYAGLFVKGAFIDAGVAALSAARSIGAVAFAPIIAGFNALRSAVVGYAASAAVLGHGGAMKIAASSMLGMLNPVRLLTGAFRVLKMALIGSGIGLALIAVGAAGAFIYNQWEGVKVAFEAFKGAFMRAIEPVRPALEPVIEGISTVFGWVSNLLGPIDDMNGKWAAAGVAAGKFVGDTIAAVVQLPGRIAEIAGEAYEAGKRLGQSIYDGVVELIAKLGSYIRDTLSSAVSSVGSAARNLASRLSFGLIGGSDEQLDGARAAGGPVRAGGHYLVGERGPEIFSPKRSGVISPNDVYQRVGETGATGAGHGVTPSSIVVNMGAPIFNISGVADPRAAAKEAMRHMGEIVRGAVESAFSDGGV